MPGAVPGTRCHRAASNTRHSARHTAHATRHSAPEWFYCTDERARKAPVRDRVDAQRIERLFRALSDATRLRILALLVDGEVCVCRLHETLRLPQPTVSRHLAYLRRSGLVETRRDGLWIHYRLATLDDTVLRTLTDIVKHTLSH